MADHFSFEAEEAVVCAILNFSDKLADVSDRLKPEHFYQGWCREVYRTALELARKGTPVDLITVTEALRADDFLIDGKDPFLQLSSSMTNSSQSNIKARAEIVMRHADNRRKLALCNEIAEAVNENDAAKESSARSKLAAFAPSFTSVGSRLMPSFGSEGWDRTTSWLIEGFVPAASFGVVYGPSGSFKSFHVLDWAASVATGKAWMGKEVEQGLCVYVAAEGVGAFSKRVKGWEDMHNGGELAADLAIVPVSIDLLDASQVDELIGIINQTGVSRGVPVRMVVLDTLARCFSGEENSAKDMGIAISECDRIKEATGATVLAVHHSGKDADRGARGSSALRGACDFEFMVKREGEDTSYELKHTKAKDSEQQRKAVIPLTSTRLGVVSGKVETTLVRDSSCTELEYTKVSNNDMSDETVRLLMDMKAAVTKRQIKGHVRMVLDEDDSKAFSDRMDRVLDKLSADGVIAKAGKDGKEVLYKHTKGE